MGQFSQAHTFLPSPVHVCETHEEHTAALWPVCLPSTTGVETVTLALSAGKVPDTRWNGSQASVKTDRHAFTRYHRTQAPRRLASETSPPQG